MSHGKATVHLYKVDTILGFAEEGEEEEEKDFSKKTLAELSAEGLLVKV